MLTSNEQVKKADDLYGERYASIYNDMWWNDPHWKPMADFHQQVLGKALQGSKNWLDVGCGTGYFLSKFPHVDRSGLDRSASMLKRAREANPTATFYQQSMTDRNTDLEGKFDLVSCTGQPYCYLPTMDDVELTIARLAAWTAEGGKCVLVPSDLVDVWNTEYPSGMYDMSGQPLNSYCVKILGVIWTHQEHDGSFYYQLCPQLDQLVRWFATHFRKVEILVRPDSGPDTTQVMRRVIVASEKRKAGDSTPATVVAPPESELYRVRAPEGNSISNVSNKALLKELGQRLKSGKLMKAALKKISS